MMLLHLGRFHSDDAFLGMDRILSLVLERVHSDDASLGMDAHNVA